MEAFFIAENGGDIEAAALATFTGNWEKNNGFTKVIVRNPKQDILPENVLIKFIKE